MQFYVPKSGMSVHFPTCLVHKISGQRKGQHTTIKYRSCKNLDPEKLQEDQESLPFSVLDTFDDLYDALGMIVSVMESVMDKHLPLRQK